MKCRVFIKTKSYIGLDFGRFSEVFLDKDIPVDPKGLPYIPLDAALLSDDSKSLDIPLGIARLKNYEGLLSELNLINNLEGVSSKIVTELYTKIITDKDGQTYRVLLPDLTFVAKLDIEESRFAIIEKKLSSIHQIGIINELIKGLVDISVEKSTGISLKRGPLKLSDKKTFSRIDYTLEIRSPLCIYTPYERDTKTRSYIPGSELLAHLQKIATDTDQDILDEPGLICSNVYPTCNDLRGIPAPLSMVIEKLNKNSLWSKLATPPKDKPSIQTVRINGDYIIGHKNKTVTRFSTDITSIYPVQAKTENLCGSDGVRDAIKEGQIFKGYFKGSDKQIRTIARLLSQKPSFNIGFYADEGYGEVFLRIDHVEEQSETQPYYAHTFDVFALAPVIMYNCNGLYSYSADSFLNLLEEKLGAKGKLEFVTKMTDSGLIYPISKTMESCDAPVKSLLMGSCFRIRTKDKSLIDIGAIRRTFVGCNTRYGFGEILVQAPDEKFYRVCEDRDPDSYTVVSPHNTSDLESMAKLCQNLLKRILYYKIARVAIVDSEDNFKKGNAPLFLLRKMAESYAPGTTDEELESLYQEVLEYVAE